MALLAEDNKLGKGDPVRNIARGCTVRIQPTCKACKISWSRLTFATLRHFEILYPLWTYDPLIIFDPYFAWFRHAKAAALEAWLDQTCLGELSSTNAHGTTIEDWQMMIHNELWWCNGRTRTISDFGDRWSPHVSTWPFVIFCPGGRPSTSDFARLGAFAPCQAARFAMKFQVGSGDMTHMTGVLSQVRLCRPSPFMFLSALD
jgi:hypothetical protein